MWIATDPGGAVWVYENEPTLIDGGRFDVEGGESMRLRRSTFGPPPGQKRKLVFADDVAATPPTTFQPGDVVRIKSGRERFTVCGFVVLVADIAGTRALPAEALELVKQEETK